MELKTSIEELKQSLLESEAFVRYQKVRAEVHNYPEKEYRLHEFRRKNYFLQNSREQLDLFTEEDRLEQEYADVYKDPLLGEYLVAEVAVCLLAFLHTAIPNIIPAVKCVILRFYKAACSKLYLAIFTVPFSGCIACNPVKIRINPSVSDCQPIVIHTNHVIVLRIRTTIFYIPVFSFIITDCRLRKVYFSILNVP